MIELRDFVVSDAVSLVSWVDGPAELVMWSGATGFTWPLDERQVLRYAAGAHDRMRVWTAVDRDDPGKPLAHASMMLDAPGWTARLGRVLVAPGARGCGVGEALVGAVQRVAFDEMGVHRVSLGVFTHNATAVRLYERLGFVREGTLREVATANGVWWSSFEMSILADEWRSRPAS
ncbi:aminoglycoside N(6')-acetyltransferase [Sphaerisporangium melleum]|uniref:Aminoglycoside N(6')-acetyltransferase n=1 Tax=Sphaerisporangium melleum TaxID=321316 RepID=A0A917VRL2_9ACTN|nr:GNAT family protein [Sphaerisporangium melleum]GGL10841.1 aminoglycoside N(6')-acetyltransferase [Sphaerisporangium melleum]GII69094.1 aminoglycoside N(6')-acetyltransferase [Sphaerisporangium melleum]